MIKNGTIAILRTSNDLMRDHEFTETRLSFNASQVEGNIGEAVNSS